MKSKLFNVHVIDEEGDLMVESEDIPWKDVPKLMEEFLKKIETTYLDEELEVHYQPDWSVLVSIKYED